MNNGITGVLFVRCSPLYLHWTIGSRLAAKMTSWFVQRNVTAATEPDAASIKRPGVGGLQLVDASGLSVCGGYAMDVGRQVYWQSRQLHVPLMCVAGR